MKPLYPFQRIGAAWLSEHRTALLADEMGTGKSAQSIRAADRVKAMQLLIICPAIARDLWALEIETWQTITRSIQIVRTAADAKNFHGDVVIVSYALLEKIRADLVRRRWPVVIADECQNLKNVGAVRTKAFYSAKNGIMTAAYRIWLLSGMPSPNQPGDLWPAYFCLFGGKLSYPSFIGRYCTVKETEFGKQVTGADREHAAELAAFLRPHFLQRKMKDVLPELPPLVWGHLPVSPDNVPPPPEMTPEIAAILGKIERDEALSVTERMALATLRRWTGIAKAPVVLELVQTELDASDKKILLFGIHKDVIRYLADGLDQLAATIDGDTSQADRQKIIAAFQRDGGPRVLVLQLAVASTALTLTAASRVVFAETSWTPSDLVQGAARARRVGQVHPVLASVVSLAGSIDARVNGTLLRKAAELARFENLIREEAVA